jgi:2-aminoethylphosphonate-pyruvate transaminase
VGGGGGADAVVLAAGRGIRLQGVHGGLPKGLLRVGGAPLIQRSLETLQACGVGRVVLITGYRADAYRDFLSDRFPSVEVRHNPDFAHTGSMHSLFMARDAMEQPFLLVESDLLYESRAVIEMLDRPAGDHLLLSGATGQGDEVYAYGAGGRLLRLSKARLPHAPLQGEFVGICRLTPATLEAMCRHYESRAGIKSRYEYDDCLSDLSGVIRFNLHRIDDLRWAEIDDPAQYRRAVESLVPALDGALSAHVHPA